MIIRRASISNLMFERNYNHIRSRRNKSRIMRMIPIMRPYIG